MKHLSWSLFVVAAVLIATGILGACTRTTPQASTPITAQATAGEPTAAPTQQLSTVASDSKKPVIAFSGFSSTNAFWVALAAAAADEAEAQGAYLVDMTTARPSAEDQVTAIDKAVAQKVDAIIVGAVDPRVLDNAMTRAQAANIPVIAVDTGIDHPWVKALIQTDNLAAAEMAGDYIVKTAGPTCHKLLLIGGRSGHQTAEARKVGVQEVAKAAGFDVFVVYTDWLEQKAQQGAQVQLGLHPDICAVFAAWDPGALAALAVIKERGLSGKLILVGFDAIPDALRAIEAGDMTATVLQDPRQMGAKGVELALEILRGEEVPRYTPIDGSIIDKSNVEQYLSH